MQVTRSEPLNLTLTTPDIMSSTDYYELTCQKMNYEYLLVKNGLQFGQSLESDELSHSDAVLWGDFPAEVVTALFHDRGEVQEVSSCQHFGYPGGSRG